VRTGIDLDALIGVPTGWRKSLGRELPGRVYRAGPWRPSQHGHSATRAAR